MALDRSDYQKLKEIEADLNEIKLELKTHNELMVELVAAVKNLMFKG